jgi:hypothetical protein
MIRTASMSGRWSSLTQAREIYDLVENIRSILIKFYQKIKLFRNKSCFSTNAQRVAFAASERPSR